MLFGCSSVYHFHLQDNQRIVFSLYMDDATKKFVEGQIERLAVMVAKGFEQTTADMTELQKDVTELQKDVNDIKHTMTTKDDIVRLEDVVESGIVKLSKEDDELRDRMRVLGTRVDRLEVTGSPHAAQGRSI